MFGWFKKKAPPPVGPDFSAIDTPAKAEAWFRRGDLEKLFLMPLEYGGEDSPLSQETTRGLHGPSRDLTGKTSLPQLAAVLAACDVMVSNDTGPLHLAAALGRPCVAPYTCTRVARHGPFGSAAGGVETSVACGGSYLKTCAKMVCMADLTPDRPSSVVPLSTSLAPSEKPLPQP